MMQALEQVAPTSSGDSSRLDAALWSIAEIKSVQVRVFLQSSGLVNYLSAIQCGTSRRIAGPDAEPRLFEAPGVRSAPAAGGSSARTSPAWSIAAQSPGGGNVFTDGQFVVVPRCPVATCYGFHP